MAIDIHPVLWAAATVGFYMLSLAAHRHHSRWWTSPLVLTWAQCFTLALALHVTYRDYIQGTHWLLTMLGPATVAFAMPIYGHRALIRNYWAVLLVGVIAGSVVAFTTTWLMAGLLDLPTDLRLSLMPRSVTTPFALEFVKDVGGVPELAAVCVVVTGLLGAAVGESMLIWLPLRSALARGALFGMGAHAVGMAKAREIGDVEGSVAGLTMILAGVASVLAAPVLACWLR